MTNMGAIDSQDKLNSSTINKFLSTNPNFKFADFDFFDQAAVDVLKWTNKSSKESLFGSIENLTAFDPPHTRT